MEGTCKIKSGYTANEYSRHNKRTRIPNRLSPLCYSLRRLLFASLFVFDVYLASSIPCYISPYAYAMPCSNAHEVLYFELQSVQ